VIFSIDHVVFSATPAQRDELMTTLGGYGFTPERFTLEFPEIGAKSDSLSFSGGGFVEFVTEFDATRSPAVWFEQTPRVIGLGFASDAFERDVGGWTHDGAWKMNEDHVLPDGKVLNIHAAGPHVHLSDFYVFVMDRRPNTLEFPRTQATASLRQIQIQGQQAESWQRDLASWLQLESEDDRLRVGETAVSFSSTSQPGVRATLVFSGPFEADSTIPLAGGAIVLEASD
jgi:hypothetical protein